MFAPLIDSVPPTADCNTTYPMQIFAECRLVGIEKVDRFILIEKEGQSIDQNKAYTAGSGWLYKKTKKACLWGRPSGKSAPIASHPSTNLALRAAPTSQTLLRKLQVEYMH